MLSDKIFGIKEYSKDEFGRTLDVAFAIEKTVYPETVKTAYREICRGATEPLVDGTPIVIPGTAEIEGSDTHVSLRAVALRIQITKTCFGCGSVSKS